MAPTPFSNEEVQSILEYLPNKRYLVEAVSTTSAPYGDKFTVYFKYDIRADGPSSSTLLLICHVEFLPSMNRMLKPMVAKAVEGGCCHWCMFLSSHDAVVPACWWRAVRTEPTWLELGEGEQRQLGVHSQCPACTSLGRR